MKTDPNHLIRFSFARRALSAIVSLAALILPLSVPSAIAAERPFHGSLTGDLVDSNNFNLLRGTGEGQITHMGSSWGSVAILGGIRFPGLLIHAANGDFLRAAAVNGVFDPETGVFIGTLIFTNGTGRFEDVTGSAEMRLTVTVVDGEVVDGPFELIIDGSIDY